MEKEKERNKGGSCEKKERKTETIAPQMVSPVPSPMSTNPA